MFPSAIYAFVLLFQICSFKIVLATEPVCSKFSYEEQLLEKMIRTEIKVESIENEIKKTQDTVLNTLKEVKKTVADITHTFEEMRNNITEGMERMSKDIEQEVENMKKPPVAFYADHVTDTSLDTTGKIIVFDNTITNEGSGYSTSTGIFTAPVGGLYQFTVHVCAYYRQHSFIGLVVAGNVIAKDSNYDENYYTCSSLGAIVRVKSGEQVWVKCTSGASSRKLFEDSLMLNTFSGVLIYH
ncbi:complement C1q and tumor necrosis factor-related protein 9A-like [Mercenaria mercenaria]|uniref:complement C1q and tumor necrosis factor-related protein 9A-like n=1 Tax=Mercenaria mercenaria TaxID=6596 RepID=UPI00234EDFE5|nr:complement C1q and tumor necrosis factor-related protein 9A-like [Mercenaria mercenaria]